jgi:hypothetical protein
MLRRIDASISEDDKAKVVELDGYAGWQIDSTVDEIVKKKEKQKKPNKLINHFFLCLVIRQERFC